jgi:hypothetical protein
MGRGFKRSGVLVFVTVTAFGQLAGCGGRAAAPSDSGNSASLSGGAGVSNAGASGSTGTIASGGFDAGTVATGNIGGGSQTLPDGCAVDVCCNDDVLMRAALSGQPCPKAGAVCGPGGCTLNCYCMAGDAGAPAWECLAPPCK